MIPSSLRLTGYHMPADRPASMLYSAQGRTGRSRWPPRPPPTAPAVEVFLGRPSTNQLFPPPRPLRDQHLSSIGDTCRRRLSSMLDSDRPVWRCLLTSPSGGRTEHATLTCSCTPLNIFLPAVTLCGTPVAMVYSVTRRDAKLKSVTIDQRFAR